MPNFRLSTHLCRGLLTLCFVGGSAAGAQGESNSTVSTGQDSQNPLTTQVTSASVSNQVIAPVSTLGIQIQSFVYQTANTTGPQNEQSFEAEYKFKSSDADNSAVHIIFGGYPETEFTYLAMPVAYVGYEFSKTQTTYLGRKIESANYLDSFFNLGLVQSTLTQDSVRYVEQGRTGLHHHARLNSAWHLTASVLPIYIPNQGPGVREENGQIVAANRWAKRPPSKFAFNESHNEIVYAIGNYKLQDIVFNPGVSTALNWAQDEMLVSVGYSRAPLNEIVLTRETYADLDVVGQVRLAPVVIYSQTATLDAVWKKNDVAVNISYIQDKPENKTAPFERSIQTLQPLSGVGVGVQYDLENLLARSIVVSMAYASFWGGEIQDLNDDGSENIFTFTTERLQFKNPFRVGLEAEVARLAARPLTTKIQWTYDDIQQGSLLTTQFKYSPLASLYLNLGVDVLGSDLPVQDDSATYFLQQYQANDRVFGGLEYVF